LRLHPDAWLSRWFRVRPLVFLGRYSYFLYLFHMPALWLAHELIAPGARYGPENVLALDALAMIALCGVAVVSWRLFEAPLLALGRRVGYGRAPLAANLGPHAAARL
jgi:peptidoglycan/LPS O-acetylase OafA/YrhL